MSYIKMNGIKELRLFRDILILLINRFGVGHPVTVQLATALSTTLILDVSLKDLSNMAGIISFLLLSHRPSFSRPTIVVVIRELAFTLQLAA